MVFYSNIRRGEGSFFAILPPIYVLHAVRACSIIVYIVARWLAHAPVRNEGKSMEKFLLKNQKLFLPKNAEEILRCTAREFSKAAEKLVGRALVVEETEDFSRAGIYFALFAQVALQNSAFERFAKEIEGSDGFAICKAGDRFFVLGHTPQGVYYGAHDFLEKNAEILWGRGAKEYEVECIFDENTELTVHDYAEKSPFAVRVWNTCGIGSGGKDHADDGTAVYYSKNKINGFFHTVEPAWKTHGARGVGVVATYANNIDFLAESKPQYFMTDENGQPKVGMAESFVNYYDEEVPKIVAKRFVEFLNSEEADPNDLYSLIMPDSPYFCVEQDGVALHKQPFTADDGTVVLPDADNYRSTVYFNYMNRVVREINALRPNTDVLTFAYLYSEVVPAIETDEHLIVSLAPIYTNEKYAYTDEKSEENRKIARNIEAWSKKCKKLCLYTYWDSFRGTIYTRPILKEVKENLLWFRALGVYGLTAEGKLDCSLVENMSERQKAARKFFDMNEGLTWAMNKLMWNPNEDVDELMRRYSKIVYKETAEEYFRYYKLLEKGFASADAYVWYPTGGDVYILQFIVNAGIKDEVLATLERAVEKATTEGVKARLVSILETVREQIGKYANFVKEDGSVTFVEALETEILSEEALDYKNNSQSVWRRALPMTVLRNYDTMEFYAPEAAFECRMLFDGKSLYVGYSIADDKVVRAERSDDGFIKLYRENGERVISYAETYVGGNVLNQTTYYGYISGFRETAQTRAFYKNEGVPTRVKEETGVADTYFVKLSDDPQERYYFHVQKIPITALGATEEDFTPYGSFVYYTNRFQRAGWMGFGLWSKQNFQKFDIRRKTDEGNG